MYSFDSLRNALRPKSKRQPKAPAAPRTQPRVESLEERCLMAYTVLDLGTFGGAESIAYGINEAGQVVGNAQIFTGLKHAFIYSNNTLTDLGTLGGPESNGFAVTEAGTVVGLAQNSDPTKTHATVWQTGQGPTSLGTLGGQKSTAYAITEDGRIVGQANTVGVPLVTHAFYYENGIMNDLGTLPGGNFSSAQGINSAGVIVGFAAPSGNTPQHAFRYVGGQMQDLGTLGGADSKAYAINEKGHIVGSSQLANGERHATLYIRDTWKDLGTLGGITSEAFAINDSTWIVGTSLNASGESRAFLWKGGFMHDLNTVVQGSGWVFTEARGINNKGQIVGVGISPNDEKHAFLITPDVTEGLGASRLADLVTASRLQTHADIVTPAPVGASRSAPAATPAASVPLAQDAKPATVTNAPNRALSRVVATTSADALVGASVLRLEVAISSRV